MADSLQNRCPVALVQHPPVFLNLEASVDKALDLIREAARGGARIIVFPETWLPGYPVWLDESPRAGLWDHAPAKALYQVLAENSPAFPGPQLQKLQDAALEARALVVMGAHERRGGTLYNSMFYLGADGKTQVHRKLMPTYTERLVWGQGDGSTLGTVPTEFGPVGGLICWEHWMPLARAAMHARRETIHVAQWPTVKDLHQVASRHYAFEGQCFVLASGGLLRRADVLEGFASLRGAPREARELLEAIPDAPGSWLQRGGSAVIAPDASYVTGPVFEEARLVTAELDLSLIARGHLALDTDGHYSRPDVFRLEVDERPREGVSFRSP